MHLYETDVQTCRMNPTRGNENAIHPQANRDACKGESIAAYAGTAHNRIRVVRAGISHAQRRKRRIATSTVCMRGRTSSSIIQRHGRVRTVVCMQVYQQRIASFFLIFCQSTMLSPPPTCLPGVSSFGLQPSPFGFRLPRLPVGGRTAPPRAPALPVCRGRTRLSWRLVSWLHLRGTPSTTWPPPFSFYPSPVSPPCPATVLTVSSTPPHYIISYEPVSRILGAAFTGGGGENTRPYECHSSSTVYRGGVYVYAYFAAQFLRFIGVHACVSWVWVRVEFYRTLHSRGDVDISAHRAAQRPGDGHRVG